MWLTKQLNRAKTAALMDGEVMGGEKLEVRGESEYRSPEGLFPYGFSSLAAGGQRAVMLNGRYAGVSGVPNAALKEGEVLLYSMGGAEIWLKNNGEIVINGQVFPAKQEA